MLKGNLLYLSPEDLKTHPKNIRRFYPENQVKEMAVSIKARGGVRQALLIVPNGEKGKFYVVDGNIRLAGGRLLGKDCPKLKCEVVDDNAAEQLLTMAVTCEIRYDPDPVSKALHYRRLMVEEKYSKSDISKATGVCITTIENRLELLELDTEIQDLVACGKLPSDIRATKAFLSIPDAKVRVKLAQRLAYDGITIKVILASCEKLLKKMGQESDSSGPNEVPALTVGAKRASGKRVSGKEKVKWETVREVARETCSQCDIKLSLLKASVEPAWSLITHAAGETCGHCDLKTIRSSCGECPAVEIIRRLTEAVGAQ